MNAKYSGAQIERIAARVLAGGKLPTHDELMAMAASIVSRGKPDIRMTAPPRVPPKRIR